MRRLWRGVGERPETQGLHASVSAEGLLCVGILTGWIGSKIQIKDAQEDAKNLQDRLLKYEKTLIKQALAQANGRVTHAASLLSIVVKR